MQPAAGGEGDEEVKIVAAELAQVFRLRHILGRRHGRPRRHPAQVQDALARALAGPERDDGIILARVARLCGEFPGLRTLVDDIAVRTGGDDEVRRVREFVSERVKPQRREQNNVARVVEKEARQEVAALRLADSRRDFGGR